MLGKNFLVFFELNMATLKIWQDLIFLENIYSDRITFLYRRITLSYLIHQINSKIIFLFNYLYCTIYLKLIKFRKYEKLKKVEKI